MNVCRCGHTTEREKHPNGGPCGAYRCECEAFADVWDSQSLRAEPEPEPEPEVETVVHVCFPTRELAGETWIGLSSTHTTRLAAGQ